MDRHFSKLGLLAAGLLVFGSASAQVESVPMKGLDNTWVKELDLKGKMDWEWIDTYPSQVYFATREDHHWDGDVVTMWTRVEYRDPQDPDGYRSALSRDKWDCKEKRKANVNTVYYRWHNLQDDSPMTSRSNLTDWQKVKPGTLGETLLQFACDLDKAK